MAIDLESARLLSKFHFSAGILLLHTRFSNSSVHFRNVVAWKAASLRDNGDDFRKISKKFIAFNFE